ncbi:MAG TPA: cell division protein ZapA [Polyangiaceae bacterium LLY-WYZ-15_(1-7)]|nr:cell division protein ZapA [Polyangiaceae bacterium LLY-WYZ-15_(1-7)]HJL38939.1 cell division protein ZapA [Polyangiaceae bacterium LLY-WYZ-15_(1-7)]
MNRLRRDRPDGYGRRVVAKDEMQTVTLEIAGAKYRMSSDTSEEHLLRLADTVNARIDALGPKAIRNATPAQLLAVVALSLAEDLEEAEHKYEGLKERTREVVRGAISRIDARLAEDLRGD